MPKKEDDNFLGGCVSSGILHARMLHFVEQLAQNGYSGATPEAIVDQWFTDLCKGIARQQQESGSFVANEDIIKMSDLQREENEKDKDDE